LFSKKLEPDSQEFVLRWSPNGDSSLKEIERQQWTLRLPQSTREVEEYRVDLSNVTVLELIDQGENRWRSRSRVIKEPPFALHEVQTGPRLQFASEPGIKFRVYLKYELGVVPKTFLNMEMKALGVL
jgi:hypothetical protein